MSVLSFTVFCIEHYAAHRGISSPEAYALFKREGLLGQLRSDYGDLHGMGKEYLMQYFDEYLGAGGVWVLYHGSTEEVREPKVMHGDAGRDFGSSFYTTSLREQAERWAKRKARLLRKKGQAGARAVVNRYEWVRREDLAEKAFEGASLEWLDLVVQCRSQPAYVHGYDVVRGKVANDTVGETISYVLSGIMRKEDALARLQFEKINDQVAFCSERALATLRFAGSYEVEV